MLPGALQFKYIVDEVARNVDDRYSDSVSDHTIIVSRMQ